MQINYEREETFSDRAAQGRARVNDSLCKKCARKKKQAFSLFCLDGVIVKCCAMRFFDRFLDYFASWWKSLARVMLTQLCIKDLQWQQHVSVCLTIVCIVMHLISCLCEYVFAEYPKVVKICSKQSDHISQKQKAQKMKICIKKNVLHVKIFC